MKDKHFKSIERRVSMNLLLTINIILLEKIDLLLKESENDEITKNRLDINNDNAFTIGLLEYCRYCGSRIIENARFCYNCGNDLANKQLQEPIKIRKEKNKTPKKISKTLSHSGWSRGNDNNRVQSALRRRSYNYTKQSPIINVKAKINELHKRYSLDHYKNLVEYPLEQINQYINNIFQKYGL